MDTSNNKMTDAFVDTFINLLQFHKIKIPRKCSGNNLEPTGMDCEKDLDCGSDQICSIPALITVFNNNIRMIIQ